MLIQFSFSNFKSFKGESILDLSATKITENSCHVFSAGNEKLLPSAAVFGANASGKSNMIEAFRFMATYVIFSFGYGGDGSDSELGLFRPHCVPFRFDADSLSADSVFEVYFVRSDDGKERVYNYGFAIKQEIVTEEWLNVKSKTAKESRRIFYRSGTELDLSGLRSRSSQDNLKAALEPEALIVSLGTKLRIPELKAVRDWFLGIGFADFGDPLENIMLSNAIPEDFAEDKDVQRQVVDYLSTFDRSIIGFIVKESPFRDVENPGKRKLDILSVHRMKDGTTATIPFKEESAGTIKMFSLFSAFSNALKNGSLLFIDELNSRLHPLLVRNFLLAFLNPEINRKHAQIVFTSHDTWLLSNNLLRRDEIWFTDKDRDEVSVLYSLADFLDDSGTKIRKDENYEKNYLLGKYGAIPSLEALDMLAGF